MNKRKYILQFNCVYSRQKSKPKNKTYYGINYHKILPRENSKTK